MLGRKKTPDQEPATPSESAAERSAEQKKNRPTPSRREREAQRQQPLVPTRGKPKTPADKDRVRREREQARLGMMNGEERFLGPRDAGEQRRWIRDYVDARFSLGEIFIPLALLILVAGLFSGPNVQVTANLAVYGLVVLLAIDGFLLNIPMKRRMRARFGDDLQSGATFYAIMRALQMRRLRMPRPRVKRGQYPD